MERLSPPPFGTSVPKSLSAGAALASAALSVNVALVEFFSWFGLEEAYRAGDVPIPPPGFPNIPLILLLMAGYWLACRRFILKRRFSLPSRSSLLELGLRAALIAPFFLIGAGIGLRTVGIAVEAFPENCHATARQGEATLLRAAEYGGCFTAVGALAVGAEPVTLRRAIVEAAIHQRTMTLRLLLLGTNDPDASLNPLRFRDVRWDRTVVPVLIAHARRNGNLLNRNLLRERLGEVLAEAAHRRDRELVEYLIDAGADLNMTDSAGKTALLEFAGDERADDWLPVIRRLVESGAALDVKDGKDLIPLMSAIQNRQPETIEYLLQRKSPLWMSGNNVFTILMKTGDPNLVRLVFRNVSGERIESDFFESNYGIAAMLDHPDPVKMMFTVWESLEPAERMIFIRRLGNQSELTAVRFAIHHGFNPNDGEKGDTPLCRAVRLGDPQLVSFLIENGADPNLPDSDGFVPLDYAYSDGMKKFLRSHGGRFRNPFPHDCGC